MNDLIKHEPVIAARVLTKRYGSATAVDRIDFNINKGEVFGLLGPNGAGKTTTILMMLGLTDITSGTVRVLGHDPAREPLKVKRQVGYLPDSVGFYDHMTAAEPRHRAHHDQEGNRDDDGADNAPHGRGRDRDAELH